MSAYMDQQFKAFGSAQVLIVLKQPTGAAAAAASASSLSKHFQPVEEGPFASLATSMSLHSGGGGGGRRAKVRTPGPMRVYEHLGLAYGTVDREGLAALRKEEQVSKVLSAPEFSLIRPTEVRADATLKTVSTWGIAALEAPKLWKKDITGKGVLVGHLDTGADGRHEALKDAIAEFAEFDPFGVLVTPTPKPFDSAEHGTHTAATIAGRPIESGGKTQNIGVAPGASLACALVIEGGDVVARILGGMNWAVGKGVRVLSMSLGLRGFHDDFQVVTQILRNKNVLPIFAVGNEGAGSSRSPGNYPEALSVGAHDKAGVVADFSSSQRFDRKDDPFVPDLVAPGVDVISAKPGGGLQSMDGSSMATPHIAGLAALLIQALPGASPDQIEAAIFKSCEGGPGLPEELANRGTPNAVRALEHLLS